MSVKKCVNYREKCIDVVAGLAFNRSKILMSHIASLKMITKLKKLVSTIGVLPQKKTRVFGFIKSFCYNS